MAEVLHEFYAVTKTSLYLVTDVKDPDGIPLVAKRLQDGSSRLECGQRLEGGSLVAVTRRGLIMFNSHPKAGRRIEQINSNYWGGGTTGIVALFLREFEATYCFNNADFPRISSDPSWSEYTRAVLDAIGNDHPVFVLSQSDNFKFPEQP